MYSLNFKENSYREKSRAGVCVRVFVLLNPPIPFNKKFLKENLQAAFNKKKYTYTSRTTCKLHLSHWKALQFKPIFFIYIYLFIRKK